MIIYLAGLCLSVISVLFLRPKQAEYLVLIKDKKICISKFFICFLLAMLPLTIISAIRYDVGTDYFNTYVDGFEIIKNGSSIRDGGFGIISKIVLLFTNDYAGLFIASSLLIGIFVYLAIFEQSENIVFSIILYMITCEYFISMNMVRQSLATAIFLYAIKYLQNKKYKKYIICILIAITIHTSAIIYLGLLFYDLMAHWWKQIFASCILIFLFSDRISTILKLLVFKVPFFRRYFYWYFNSKYNSGDFNVFSFLVQFAILIMIVTIYSIQKNEKIKLYLSLQFMAVIFLLLSKSLPLAQRMSYLFSFANIIFIPNSIAALSKKKYALIIVAFVVIFFSIYMWITIVIRGYNEVLPYQTIFAR